MEPLWKNNLRNIEPYIPGEQPKTTGIIKLNANENPYPPSPKAADALGSYPKEQLRLYPDSQGQCLKKALAAYHHVEENQIFIGNGSDEVIAMAFLAFFNGEDPILFPDITYSFYKVWCNLFQTNYETVPLTGDFHIDPRGYHKKNGGVILPNPNAPTGIGEGREFIEEILNHNQDVIVIIDEAYVDFGGYSSVELLKKYENLLIVQTFSKSRSLAGLRIGTAIGNPCLIDVLEAVKNAFNSYTIDSLSLVAAAASLEDTEYFRQTVNRIIHTRCWFTKELESLDFTVLPSSTNFVLASHPVAEAKALFTYLKEQNIFVRYFEQPRLDNYLRITIGTEEDMKALLEKIKEYINGTK